MKQSAHERSLVTAIRDALRAFSDSATELDVAKAIRDGDLESPQPYENILLFALRITGTGTSFRPARGEYVYRTPSDFLTGEFVERCQGLPVVFEHPTKSGVLNSDEYRERAIGTILLPYIKGDEVWGIAKIFDADAAKLMQTTHVSTSPAVVFRDADSTETVATGDGKTLLIEGKPSYLDHLAICEEGVWDKGGKPSGIQLSKTEEADMADEQMVPAWADALNKRIDEVCNRIDALGKGRADGDFDKLEKKLEGEGKSEESAEKIAGAIGEKKFGKEGMEAKSEAGKEKAEKKDAGEPSEEAGEREIKASEKAENAREHKENKDDEDARADKGRWTTGGFMEGGQFHPIRNSSGYSKTRAGDSVTADSTQKPIAELEAQIAAMAAQIVAMAKPLGASERDELARVQARADTLGTMLGETISHPLHGESPIAYRKRLAARFQKHSTLQEIKLDSIEGQAFDLIEERIYADAREAALNPSEGMQGRLVPIVTRDSAGREITRYAGNSDAFKVAFASCMPTPLPVRITKPFHNQESV